MHSQKMQSCCAELATARPAEVPQYVFSYRDVGNKEIGVNAFVVLIGSYRIMSHLAHPVGIYFWHKIACSLKTVRRNIVFLLKKAAR